MSTLDTYYQAVNPSTGKTLAKHPTCQDDEVRSFLDLSAHAYTNWAKTSPEQRTNFLLKVSEIFLLRIEELALIVTTEMGKPISQARAEVEISASIFRYYAEHAPELLADQPVPTELPGKAVVQKRALGPLFGIMPWNYPYYQVARFVAPNLLLGNTILLKHAANCPQSALAIQDVLNEAGAPAGVYINLFATRAQSEIIISDPRVQGVSLTGSEAAGAAVGRIAVENLKKVVLELGGNDPYIILDSENPRQDAQLAWATRMENTGQACNSNKRLIIQDDIFDEFVDELTKLAEKQRPGDPTLDEDDAYAPMSSRTAAEHLNQQVQDAVDKGATLHAGGKLSEGPEAYFSPAVITGVTPSMRLFNEEPFGPVAVVYRFTDDQQAVELANDSNYGLGGAVFSASTSRAANVAMQLEVGMANVNTPAAEGPEIPFGGVKNSGFGRELGALGIDEFCNKRLFFIADN